MNNALEWGKRLLISVVAAVVIIAIVIVLIEWKNIMNPTFTCALCMEEMHQIPKKVTLLGQEVKICRDCMKTLEQLGSLFG